MSLETPIADTAGEIMGVRAAARALEIDKSTVSRYLKDFPELNLGVDGAPKVEIAALRAHRLENINLARSGSHAGRLLGEAAPIEDDSASIDDIEPRIEDLAPAGGGDASVTKKAAADAGAPSYAVAKAVRETVLAQRARIDLDEKRGLLIVRAEVEDAIAEAGTVLQRELLELGSLLSDRLSAMESPREIALLLESEHRRVLAGLAATLRASALSDQAQEKAIAFAEV